MMAALAYQEETMAADLKPHTHMGNAPRQHDGDEMQA